MPALKTITGILRFISQYKQLSLEITEKEYTEIMTIENHGLKALCWIKKNDDDMKTYHTKLSLVKYLKDDEMLMKIEGLENKKITAKVQVRHYDSDEFGAGTSLVARKIWGSKV